MRPRLGQNQCALVRWVGGEERFKLIAIAGEAGSVLPSGLVAGGAWGWWGRGRGPAKKGGPGRGLEADASQVSSRLNCFGNRRWAGAGFAHQKLGDAIGDGGPMLPQGGQGVQLAQYAAARCAWALRRPRPPMWRGKDARSRAPGGKGAASPSSACKHPKTAASCSRANSSVWSGVMFFVVLLLLPQPLPSSFLD